MKSLKILFIICVIFILISCSNKTTSGDNEIPTYEETGVIDEGGGIVHITDEQNILNGTYVNIPEGALENSVEISIFLVEEFTFIDTTAIVVDFTPTGTQFSELVEIGIPYKENSDIDNLQLYTYNEENEAWEVMMIDHIDTQNKLVISKTNHFSWYTTGDYASMFEVQLYKTSSNKIGLYLQAPEFSGIPTRLAYWSNGHFNIEQCIDGGPYENFPKAWFRVTVLEDTWWFPETFSYKAIYYDKYTQASPFGNWKAEINDRYGAEILNYNEWLDLNELSDFFSGKPLIIESDAFDTSEDFIITVEFYYSQYTDYLASSTLLGRYTPIFSFAIENIDFSDLSYVPNTLDEDGNNITNDYDVPETDPVVEIITPVGVQSGNITINYNITDEDGGLNEFGVYYQSMGTGTNLATLLSTTTGSIHLVGFIQNIESGNQSFVWDSYNDFPDDSGQFKILMSWVDPEGGMPGLIFESNYFEVDNTQQLPPNPPSNPNPSHNATNVSINTDLSWECSDPNGDPLTYDIYFGTSSNPPIVNNGQSGTTYDLGTLEEETTYYWKIVAHDNHSNSTTGNIWIFTTIGPVNQPPNPPSNPNPSDNATEVSINTNLSWECTDPENDPLTYDIYFGTSSNPPIVNNGQSGTTYYLGTLEEETTYYWKIVAYDNHSNSTTGNVWHFTTAGDTEPPFIGNIYIPEPGSIVSGSVTLETFAIDNVGVSYVVFEVFRNGVGYEEVGIDYTPDANDHFSVEFNSELFENGEHNIHATAYDDAGNTAMAGWAINFLNGTGTVTDIDGNVYQTIQIDDQEWMMENLKVTHYRNGDAIPHLTSNDDWISTSDGAYCIYDNNPSNAETYGALYNWFAVDDPRGIAPEGWHVPTDEEIMELEMALGMSQSQANSIGWRGTNEGSKLAGRADLWANGALENNAEFGVSGFSFLPGGYRSRTNGSFGHLSHYGYLWSSIEYNSNSAWHRVLTYDTTGVCRDGNNKRFGFSVRCVRD